MELCKLRIFRAMPREAGPQPQWSLELPHLLMLLIPSLGFTLKGKITVLGPDLWFFPLPLSQALSLDDKKGFPLPICREISLHCILSFLFHSFIIKIARSSSSRMSALGVLRKITRFSNKSGIFSNQKCLFSDYKTILFLNRKPRHPCL